MYYIVQKVVEIQYSHEQDNLKSHQSGRERGKGEGGRGLGGGGGGGAGGERLFDSSKWSAS